VTRGPRYRRRLARRFGYEWHNYAELRPEYEEQFRRLDGASGAGGLGAASTSSTSAAAWGATPIGRCAMAPPLAPRSTSMRARSPRRRRNLAAFPRNGARAQRLRIDERDRFDIASRSASFITIEFPERAVRAMVQAVKPGGRVLIWVYGAREQNEWIVTLLDPLRKALLSRLPIGLLHHLALYATGLLWLGLRLGIGRIAYFQLLRRLSFRHLRSIVFDQMLPKIAHYCRARRRLRCCAKPGSRSRGRLGQRDVVVGDRPAARGGRIVSVNVAHAGGRRTILASDLVALLRCPPPAAHCAGVASS